MKKFYEQKRLDLVTFLDNKKVRKRNLKDLETFRKQTFLVKQISTLMSLPDEGVPNERFFELVLKIGNIHSPRVNELFEEQYPFFENYFDVV